MSDGLRVVSYGGGVQSTALLVLSATGRIDFPVFLMANVGDDSEHPATLRYVREIALPYAVEQGIELHLLDKIERGDPQTLWQRIAPDRPWALNENKLTEPLPIRGENGKPFKRSCTSEFKIRVTGRWLKAHGATENNPAVVAIGISMDEAARANDTIREPHERVVYPLIGKGEDTGLRLRRDDCARVIRDAGLPVPPKSACYFCPFHTEAEWIRQRNDEPELFERSCQMEDRLNARRDALGKQHVYLTRFGKPLRDIIPEGIEALPMADDGCDSGWCMT